jgi:hypothetical protein
MAGERLKPAVRQFSREGLLLLGEIWFLSPLNSRTGALILGNMSMVSTSSKQ